MNKSCACRVCVCVSELNASQLLVGVGSGCEVRVCVSIRKQ